MTEKIKYIDTENANYSKLLNNMYDSPHKLFFKGSLDWLNSVNVAVIGSRKPTNYGKTVTKNMVSYMSANGITVVSGLAYGIDSIAHTTAVAAGGSTVAVLAAGLDTIYPVRHTSLAADIIQTGGALVSEYQVGVSAKKHHFIARNRIITGLSKAVVVIEAGLKSGTMSTVNFALDQGLPVFAVPGPITSPASQGTNHLIQQGAIPLTNPKAILSELGISPRQAPKSSLSKNEATVVTAITMGATTIDKISAFTKTSLTECGSTLTRLEVKQLIERDALGRFTIICHR